MTQNGGEPVRLMWLFDGKTLHVEAGTDHARDLSWNDDRQVEQMWRGWFEPTRNEVLVVGPSHAGSATQLRGATRLPQILSNLLHRRFGDRCTFRIF